MQATRTTTRSADASGSAFIPAQAKPSADPIGICACGQAATSRHTRCTRCGR